MEHEPASPQDLPDPAPLVAVAFLSPWALVSLLLPHPWRMAGVGLVTLLALLLLAAAAWARRRAAQKGLDGPHWAFVTVLTMGLAMLPLAFGAPGRLGADPTYVCTECGREAPMVETFCYRCGAA
ncbi:MAG TPA: hypothetical protein VNX21_09480 [Candidatus Thermoplasmatota archaeon]|nr:hypothetical protein [Candidatus Thermoplasmatota archaeon]